MAVINSKTFFRDTTPPSDDEAICVRRNQAAAMLSISTTTLDRLVKAGEVPCLRLPGRVLFRPDALRDWAKQRETHMNRSTTGESASNKTSGVPHR